jgi:hypothetical protein
MQMQVRVVFWNPGYYMITKLNESRRVIYNGFHSAGTTSGVQAEFEICDWILV